MRSISTACTILLKDVTIRNKLEVKISHKGYFLLHFLLDMLLSFNLQIHTFKALLMSDIMHQTCLRPYLRQNLETNM